MMGRGWEDDSRRVLTLFVSDESADFIMILRKSKKVGLGREKKVRRRRFKEEKKEKKVARRRKRRRKGS